jgi:nitroreductase
MQITSEAFEQLIRERRSVFPKQFKQDEKVPDEIVRKILGNALWAPNHGQTEPWHFVVFTGEGLKKLAAFQGELYKKVSGENYKQPVFEKFTTQPLMASHVIAICMKRSKAKKFPEIEEVAAVACAVENMYLSTTVYGVGGYWTTGGVTYYEGAKSFFGLEEEDKLMGFFYLGQIAIPSPPGKRQPLEEKMEWVS